MRITTKMQSFTLKNETIKRLNEFSKKKSTNKSAFVDRIINQEIDRENKIEELQIDFLNKQFDKIKSNLIIKNSISKNENPV